MNKIKDYVRLQWLLTVATEAKPKELIDKIARQESISELKAQISDHLFNEVTLPDEIMCS